MLKNILIAFVVIIAVFVVVVAMQPDEYTVERTATIEASPAITFELINNFKAWDLWSPWDELDPSQTKTFSGPEAGVGAVTEWTGEKTGKGRMEIVASEPTKAIEIDLQFFEPFEGRSDTVFTFASLGDDTQVTWTMSGTNDFMAKAMGLFMDMEGMIGKDFEKGLAKINEAAKAESVRLAEEARKVEEAERAAEALAEAEAMEAEASEAE